MSGGQFEPGSIVATPGALEALERHGVRMGELLERHLSGDWGVVDRHDWRENDYSLRHGFRILSAYELNPNGVSQRLWLITEADRSATTLLLPSEY